MNDEIVKLRDLKDVTSIVVTHQIRDAVYVATHKAMRQNGDVTIVEADLAGVGGDHLRGSHCSPPSLVACPRVGAGLRRYAGHTGGARAGVVVTMKV